MKQTSFPCGFTLVSFAGWIISTSIGQLPAQTPWQAAPAEPAALPRQIEPSVIPNSTPVPAADTSSFRVISLPPPPTATAPSRGTPPTENHTSIGQPANSIATPAHVPLSAGRKPVAEMATPVLSPETGAAGSLTEGLLLPMTAASSAVPQPNLPPVPDLRSLAVALPPPIVPQSAIPSHAPLPSLMPNSAVVPSTPGESSSVATKLVGSSQSLQGFAGGGASLAGPDALDEFPAGRLIAVVGTEHILAGDMAVFVEPIIDQNRDRIKTPEDETRARNQLTRQALRSYVEVKAIYLEFFRDMLGTVSPKEMAEAKKKFMSRAGEIFTSRQIPVLQEKYEAKDLRELEAKLSAKSLSLLTLRSQFIEQASASELERKYVPDRFEIDRQALLEAYRAPENQEKWNVPGRARWRQITIRFDKHNGDRAVVDRLIRELGDQIYFGGKRFEAVAQQSSEGYSASEGGTYDWTTKGSLKSAPLDAAIFSLPVGALSTVITDDIGMHIVEVLEREDGHVKDFTEAQAELRESLSEARRQEEIRKFRQRIMDRTTIWTLWPEDIPGSRPLSEALGSLDY